MIQLTLTQLSKNFVARDGVIRALRELSLQVESGELLALLGPSGSGKTTLLRLIAGLLDPTAGDIRFDRDSVLRLPPEKRGAVMVFQQHSLFPFLSVGENVAFGLKMRRVGRAEMRRRVSEALDLVRLTGYADRWTDELSGGQRQRVALARALVVQPKLLLLDEPLSQLEPELREELRAEIGALQKRLAITTLFVTHDQTEAVSIASRIALMMEGTLVQVGSPRDFYERPVETRVARFFSNLNILPAHKRGQTVETTWGVLTIDSSSLPDGPVLVTIRPETVQLGSNGTNTLTGTVAAWQYLGESTRCQVKLGETLIHVTAPPFTAYRAGEPIVLHFPREHLWLMPVEPNCSL